MNVPEKFCGIYCCDLLLSWKYIIRIDTCYYKVDENLRKLILYQLFMLSIKIHNWNTYIFWKASVRHLFSNIFYFFERYITRENIRTRFLWFFGDLLFFNFFIFIFMWYFEIYRGILLKISYDFFLCMIFVVLDFLICCTRFSQVIYHSVFLSWQ